MKIGILSDTHGNIPATRAAAAVFRKAAIGSVFHCGDIGSADVLGELAVLEVSVHVVLGNVDVYSGDWKFFPTNLGVQLHGRFGDIACAGQRIALLHGDDRIRFEKAVSCGDYDLVLTGHSHEVHDFSRSSTRCINPGAAGGRGSPNTCAVLDLDGGCLEIHGV